MDAELDQLAEAAPAIALDDPKSVGKTVPASRRAVEIWQLDDPGQRERLRVDFQLASIAERGTILFDEWQRPPTGYFRVHAPDGVA